MLVTIGRKIYYNKLTGEVVYNTGERVGNDIRDTTVTEDFRFALELKRKDQSLIDVILLEPGEYAEEFSDCITYRVNPETRELEFAFRDSETPDEPIYYEKPYLVQIEELVQSRKIDRQRISDLELLLAEMIAF